MTPTIRGAADVARTGANRPEEPRGCVVRGHNDTRERWATPARGRTEGRADERPRSVAAAQPAGQSPADLPMARLAAPAAGLVARAARPTARHGPRGPTAVARRG